jgi:uncharacterized damage-inducible protein DinB
MMNHASLRRELVELLRGGSAHLSLDEALGGLEPELRHRRAGGLHSIWEILEHMRIAQEDILRYARDPSWVSPDFPEGYWPEVPDTLSDERWQETLVAFRRDLEAVIILAQDESLDLTAEIPHGQGGHSYLREILLVADHNSYHLGQIVDVRRALGDWRGERL